MLKKESPKRQIDIYFEYYSAQLTAASSKIIYEICAFGIYFSILGFSWSVPFPHVNFLGQYNSYFNWASFVIAFSIYFYSKLSPLLSYLMLFLALVFTYLITIIERHYHSKTLQILWLYLIVFFAFETIRYLALKSSGKRSTLKSEFTFIWIGPVWALHFLLKKFAVKY